MNTRRGLRSSLTISVLLSVLIAGCGGLPTSPETAVEGRTSLGLGVAGAGQELYDGIDRDWATVNKCWDTSLDGHDVTVEIMEPAFTDNRGTQVFEFESNYYYGLRMGNNIMVCADLAALKHEFSHLVGQSATGIPVQNGMGKCWL